MSDEVTEHLQALFVGVAPERAQELENFWKRYGPVVKVVSDDEQGDAHVMEAGAYRYLHFNHRAGFPSWGPADFLSWVPP
jgi:hypothetical protein